MTSLDRHPLSAALVALALSTPFTVAVSQDLVAVAPELAKVEYEDARVRVVRLHIPENAAVPMHDRPRRVVVSLSPNEVRLTRADGTVSITRTATGTFAWSEPAVRSVQNLGAPVDNIVVELKQAPEPAKPVAAPTADPPADYLVDPQHRWVLENQYVRVYDVRIPPGVTTTFHRHAHDQVSVYVSGGLVSSQVEGQPWLEPKTVMAGSLAYAANGAEPVSHRVRNDGPTEYHVILVQFLR